MSRKVNQGQSKRIYDKDSRQWFEVNEEVYTAHMHECDATRHRMQYHGRCRCPKKLFWICDGVCPGCEFQISGDILSLEYELSGEGGDALTTLDTLADPSPSAEDVVADFDELTQLLRRLAELMPEAIKVGVLREQGLKGCKDYRKAAQILEDGGYATSHTYVSKLCSIVEKWKLTKYDTTSTAASNVSSPKSDAPFLVRVSITDLNIRTGAGTNYARTGRFTGKGVFTIMEVKSGQGSTAGWGRLKSGAGWISLDYATRI